MSELAVLLETLIAEVEAARPCALCVVVGKKGSAPQVPGATLLLRADLSALGTLGGGCVEAEVCKRARQLLTTRTSGLLDFVLDHDYGWDDGLICGGAMQIAVMPVLTPEALAPFREALTQCRTGEAGRVPIVIEHEGRRLRYEVCLEPAPELVIAGAGHVGHALARLAVQLDFKVTVIDDRRDFADPARFPAGVEVVAADIPATLARWPLGANSYVVIVTRGHQHDHTAMAATINRTTRYLGLIGSRRKTRMIFEDLRETGVAEERIERVHTPIGVAIGAVTVPEIAVSIAAELIAERRRDYTALVTGPEEI